MSLLSTARNSLSHSGRPPNDSATTPSRTKTFRQPPGDVLWPGIRIERYTILLRTHGLCGIGELHRAPYLGTGMVCFSKGPTRALRICSFPQREHYPRNHHGKVSN